MKKSSIRIKATNNQCTNSKHANGNPSWWLATLLLTLFISSAALAIHPGKWTHTTEADFDAGEAEGVVITNLGDIKLAADSTVLAAMPDDVNIIYAMHQTSGGAIYLSAGPEGKLLRLQDDKVQQLAHLKEESIFALDQTAEGALLLGISGESSRLAILDGDELKTLVRLDQVRYIWDMLVIGNDVYLATGIEGQLLHVNLRQVIAEEAKAKTNAPADKKVIDGDDKTPSTTTNQNTDKDKTKDNAARDKDGGNSTKKDDAKDNGTDTGTDTANGKKTPKPLPAGVKVIIDTAQANILCLTKDAQGRLYFGTDTDGLIYRVEPNAATGPASFVMYDAPEPEISTILIDANGNIFVGTADANQAKPGRLEAAAKSETGRPGPNAKPEKLPVSPKPDDKSTPGNNKSSTTKVPNIIRATKPANGTGTTSKPANANPSGTPENTVSAKPTPEQYDQLRDEIRQRLEKARETGELQASSTPRPSAIGPAPSRPRPTGSSSTKSKAGNAIYRIDAAGFVTEVFRESVMILAMIEDNGRLVVATGNEGQIFSINIEAEETTILADLDAMQAPALMRDMKGDILIATGSEAELRKLNGGFATTGTLTSDILDAGQISLWGKLNVTTRIPEGATLAVQTRSGNVKDPMRAAWSKWSVPRNLVKEDTSDGVTPEELAITSPPARFLQYRVTLTGSGKSTPVVDRLALAYVVPNIKPSISSVTSKYTAARSSSSSSRSSTTAAAPQPAPMTTLSLEWKATDSNKDALSYTLEYRTLTGNKWLPLAKNLTTTRHSWDTRRVPDGRYVLRVTASDIPDNPKSMAKTSSRQSNPLIIDNTSPTIGPRAQKIENGAVILTTTVTDKLSAIKTVKFAVDSTDRWQALLPDDLIFDSTKESITVKIPGLSAGSHVVTIRATDALGNSHYVAEVVDIK